MNVLFAADGSNEARAAATWLSRLPFTGARLDIATVVPENSLEASEKQPTGTPRPGSREEAQWVQTQAMAEELSAAFAEVRPHLLAGRAAAQILALARITGADLIVLGHRKRTAVAETVLGSVSREVVSRSTCPVLLARAGSRFPRRVLVAFDGSVAARSGLDALLQIPLPADANVSVLTVATSIAPEVPLIDVYGAAGVLPPESCA
jgi:nucleotide-binding universal stress UspA family protein